MTPIFKLHMLYLKKHYKNKRVVTMEQTWTQEQIHTIIENQQTFFQSNKTKSIEFRKEQLIKLLHSMKQHEQAFYEAFQKDLGKPVFETYSTEYGVVIASIRQMIKHLSKWAKPQRKKRSLATFWSKNSVYLEPYGVSYIVGPFNYPLQLILVPLVGAIAAGNCALMKPASKTPNVANVIASVINNVFPKEYLYVIQGEHGLDQMILAEKLDFIFFTGSPAVGKIVMRAAAENLTPVILELGGKSPGIVTKDCDLQLAAERLVWGKFLNTGQTCIAPDYILVDDDVKRPFVNATIQAIREFYGSSIKENKDYGRIVAGSATQKFIQMIEENKEHLLFGGEYDEAQRYIEPTLFDIDLKTDNSLMADEIFGPLLPICSYRNLDEAIAYIKAHHKPLALYLFSNDKMIQEKIISEVSFGGGCINQTLLHFVNEELPFGGVEFSGMGNYHGKYSLEAFSHQKAVVFGSTKLRLKLIFPPYTDKHLNLIKKIMK